MSVAGSGFSPDGRWWWNGLAWMPTASPDGEYLRWTGKTWVRNPNRIGRLIGIVAALWALELMLAVVAVIILILAANSEYYARGRTGTEDIASTSISVPILLSLLVVPLIVTSVVSASVNRHWWLGSIAGGALPSVIAIASQRWSEQALFSIVVSVLIVSAFVVVGWAAHRKFIGRWSLSPDSASWGDGRHSYPTLSSDGQWRWTGGSWEQLPFRPPIGEP